MIEQSQSGASRAIAIAVVIVLVLIVGIATGYFVYRQVQYNDTHRPQAVTFTVNLQDYGSDDTPIPLHVVGTDLDGKPVDTEVYVNYDGTGAEILIGTYTATISESPLTNDGKIYYGSGTELNFSVVEEAKTPGVFSDGFTDDSETTIQMHEVAPLDIQESWVTNAYNAAVKSGFDQSKAYEYRKAALKAHEDAVNKKQVEQNKQSQAQATQKAAQQTSDAEAKAIEGATWYAGNLGTDGITAVSRDGATFTVAGKTMTAPTQEDARLNANTTDVKETSLKFPLASSCFYFQISPSGTKSAVESDPFYNGMTTKISGNSDQRLVWAVKNNSVVAVYLYEY